MSWQAPQVFTTVCLPGPSGKSAPGCCPCAGNVTQNRAAAATASKALDIGSSRNSPREIVSESWRARNALAVTGGTHRYRDVAIGILAITITLTYKTAKCAG